GTCRNALRKAGAGRHDQCHHEKATGRAALLATAAVRIVQSVSYDFGRERSASSRRISALQSDLLLLQRRPVHSSRASWKLNNAQADLRSGKSLKGGLWSCIASVNDAWLVMILLRFSDRH